MLSGNRHSKEIQVALRFISEAKKQGKPGIRECEKKMRTDLCNLTFSPEDFAPLFHCKQLNCQDKNWILIWQKRPEERPTWVARCRSMNHQKPAGIYALSARMIPVLTGTIRSRNVLLSQEDEQETTGTEKLGFKSGFKRGLWNDLCLRKKTENPYRCRSLGTHPTASKPHGTLYWKRCGSNLTFPPNLFNTKFLTEAFQL